ncbi:Type II secretion system protein E [Ferriphaselus amnicola]|uniref:Type II secretion system protein E n=1 Tax=Ferriphaselus amnicola TaxID=1188319 RepID=A0A2Z6GAK5_9PROT|nr:GspE/PulE family protein [Ferriphaselus amnicola]BBE50399.1 Type II secretion system protein E [Ferriphaselus amnicola]
MVELSLTPVGLPGASSEISRGLHALLARIQTATADEVAGDISRDVAALCNADRITIYEVSEDKLSLVSKVKVGLNTFKDLRLPMTQQSIAGFCALNHKTININDVYDEQELARIGSQLRFLQDVDRRTGYRTKQMLVVPVLKPESDVLVGVIQLINNKADQPFSAIVLETVQEVARALPVAMQQRQTPTAIKGKFDYLVADAVVSSAELELAARTARRKGNDVEDVLLDDFHVTAVQMGSSLSRFFSVPYEPFRFDRIKPADLLKNLKREYVVSSGWVPLEETQEGLVVLTPDPERTRASRVANAVFPKAKLVFRVCSQREFRATLDAFFSKGLGESSQSSHDMEGSVDDLLTSLGGDDDELGANPEDISAAADNELVKLVNKIIVDAYKMGASDIHIEPAPGKAKTLIRFRKDGSLLPYIEVPASYRNALITRIKIMCDLDISEKRKPQDGKIKFKKFGPLDIELRVATLPSQGGVEDIVMRILASGEPLPVEKLGLSPYNLEMLKSVVSKPYGLFFVCGPTGSGKTTTLHSILSSLNKPDTKIWTAEDPVEITQKGLRQVQINKKAGLDFATIMRAFLRADPDIIMVGEMRDKETVSIGIEASLTGHLVFATLHTNSAPESITRLLDMGMDPFNFADALLGVLAQRLTKRLCKDCRKSYIASEDEIDLLLTEYSDELKHIERWQNDPEAAREALRAEWARTFADANGQFTLYQPVGCDSCAGTGYRGRLGLHELLVGTDAMKKNIQEHARVAEMIVTALGEGMRTLKQDGIEKVLQGFTDMHQVRSVCIK